ncbi:hypothetical protein AT251_12390, partial [Enterovibrio nigricans]
MTSEGDGRYVTDTGSINVLDETAWYRENVTQVTRKTSHQRDQTYTDVQTTNRSSSTPSIIASKQNLRLISADDIVVKASRIFAAGQLFLVAANDVVLNSAKHTINRVLNREGTTN